MNLKKKKPFKIFIPSGDGKPPRHVETIEVEVRLEYGEEFLTEESNELIEKTRARHMGLMTGEDIIQMRQRLGISQQELTKLLQCGEKSLSRWENGHGFPTGIANTLLRLLDEGHVAVESLAAVQGPRTNVNYLGYHRSRERQKPLHYNIPNDDPKNSLSKAGSKRSIKTTGVRGQSSEF